MRSRTLAREMALQLLYEHDITEELSQDRIDTFTHDSSDKKTETYEYARQLVRGVIEDSQRYDSIIEKLADHWAVRRMPVVDRNILRIGAYEIFHPQQEVPPKVIINEAVDLAKKYGSADSGRFVNAILDRMHKEHDNLTELED